MRKTLLFLALLLTGINTAFSQGCMDAGSSEGVKVAGYFQPQFQMIQYKDGAGNSEWANSFTFERARFGFLGNIPYDISYYAFIETSAFKGSKPYLLDAFITYNRFSPWAKISIGSFKTPFSLEENTPCQALYTVKRSKAVTELIGYDRDLGVMISGGNDTTWLRYSIALTNGTGLDTLDDNKGKYFSGRLVFQPFDFLNIGGSVRYGTHPSLVPDADEDSRMRYAFEMELKYKNFLLQGEYLMGEDKGSYTVGGGCGGTPEVKQGSLDRSGFYAIASYMTPWKLQPVYKLESYDPNTDSEGDKIMVQTLGLNYFLNDWTRVQLNYVYAAEEKNETPNDQLYLQVQVKF